MMAVRAPLGFSPSNSLISAFSPFSDHPDSPRPRSAAAARPTMASAERDSYLKAPPPASNSITSPQDPVAPSPIVSDVGTEFADVDEQAEEAEEGSEKSETESVKSESAKSHKEVQKGPQLRLNTGNNIPFTFPPRQEYEPEPQSVIHVPTGFGTFDQTATTKPDSEDKNNPSVRNRPEIERARADSAESVKSDTTITKPGSADGHATSKASHDVPMPPTPLQTSIPSAQDWSTTPRAQTRQDLGALSRPGSSLASIMEGDDGHEHSTDDTGDESDASRAAGFFRNAQDEVQALRNALSECWTLCNTLASLSYIHRERIFNFAGKGDMQEHAWKSCWKLCQNLYDTRDESVHTYARPTLDLCRDFCQALFEVRVRDNETADSVLRVSFELNNHLFNTHDRSLPEAFRERTLDFYITLCHRLMKQKARMAEETDSLLRACWSLAEMLFSLRQSKREGRKPDEELLGSAVQACWELCDLFREGWTQIRPERGTPRPSQTTFTQAFNQAKRSGFAPLDENGNPKPLPETPTTIFEDTVNTISPDEAPVPNILVLRAQAPSVAPSTSSTPAPGASGQRQAPRQPQSAHPTTQRRFWSSASSVHSLSAISDVLNPVSAASAETVRTQQEDPTLTLLKTLFVKAAIATNRGYTRTSSDPNLNSLPNFAKSLPETAFGTQVWQVSLLDHYRKTIGNDPGFRALGIAGTLGERGRVNAVEVARAVRGMTSCVYGFGWLRDLYRYVFGFYVEEALKGETEKRAGGAADEEQSSSGSDSHQRSRSVH